MDDAFLERVRQKGESIRSRLSTFRGLENVRGLGLMIGADLCEKTASQVVNRCCEEGLLVLTAKSALRLLPPLTITDAEIEKGLAILERVLLEKGEEQ